MNKRGLLTGVIFLTFILLELSIASEVGSADPNLDFEISEPKSVPTRFDSRDLGKG